MTPKPQQHRCRQIPVCQPLDPWVYPAGGGIRVSVAVDALGRPVGGLDRVDDDFTIGIRALTIGLDIGARPSPGYSLVDLLDFDVLCRVHADRD